MVACYGWAERNESLAARRYRDIYRGRDRYPNGRVIAAANLRGHEGDIMLGRGKNGGRLITQRTPEREDAMFSKRPTREFAGRHSTHEYVPLNCQFYNNGRKSAALSSQSRAGTTWERCWSPRRIRTVVHWRMPWGPYFHQQIISNGRIAPHGMWRSEFSQRTLLRGVESTCNKSTESSDSDDMWSGILGTRLVTTIFKYIFCLKGRNTCSGMYFARFSWFFSKNDSFYIFFNWHMVYSYFEMMPKFFFQF